MKNPWRLAIALPLFLAACGTTPQDRAITGGGIGAAGGAILGAVTGLTVIQGALLATGLGAAIGGLTSADSFNLGKPFWQRSDGAAASRGTASSAGYSKSVADIQRDLKRLGYDPGPVDGVLGPRTKAAIARFDDDKGRPIESAATDGARVAATPSKPAGN
jgi:peptidoglycan hydrolase-like protein with peptidoglycan-binding domain